MRSFHLVPLLVHRLCFVWVHNICEWLNTSLNPFQTQWDCDNTWPRSPLPLLFQRKTYQRNTSLKPRSDYSSDCSQLFPLRWLRCFVLELHIAQRNAHCTPKKTIQDGTLFHIWPNCISPLCSPLNGHLVTCPRIIYCTTARTSSGTAFGLTISED